MRDFLKSNRPLMLSVAALALIVLLFGVIFHKTKPVAVEPPEPPATVITDKNDVKVSTHQNSHTKTKFRIEIPVIAQPFAASGSNGTKLPPAPIVVEFETSSNLDDTVRVDAIKNSTVQIVTPPADVPRGTMAEIRAKRARSATIFLGGGLCQKKPVVAGGLNLPVVWRLSAQLGTAVSLERNVAPLARFSAFAEIGYRICSFGGMELYLGVGVDNHKRPMATITIGG